MEYLEYAIAVVTFILAGLPMIGKNIRYDKLKGPYLRFFFIFLLAIAFIVYTYVFRYQKKEENEAQKLAQVTGEKVVSISDQLIQIEVNNLELEAKQDSIRESLSRLNNYTTQFLADIMENRNMYSELSYLAKQDLKLRKEEFSERKPQLTVLSGENRFVFRKDSSIIDLEFKIRNIGQRVAVNGQAQSLLLLTDSLNKQIVYHKRSSHLFQEGINSNTLYNGYMREIDMDVFQNAAVGILLIDVEAIDLISEKKIGNFFIAKWIKDKEAFFSYNHSDSLVVNNYLRDKSLEETFLIKQ